MIRVDDAVKSVLKSIEEIANRESLPGIPSGFIELDKVTTGFQNSTLITIGSRPSMGKSSLAHSMLIHMCVEHKVSALYYTIEANKNQATLKFLSILSGFNYKKLTSGNLEKHEWEILNQSSKEFNNANLYINDYGDWDIDNLIDDVCRNHEENNIQIVFIDYLQLISVKKNTFNVSNREQEISVIIKKLKALSKSLNIPIILFSQLSRAVENRGGSRRPVLSDLRETGAIEDDSDLVLFLYRPEYYKIDEWDDEERTPTNGQAELGISKNRFGSLDQVRLKFIEHIGKFENIEYMEVPDFFSKMNEAAFSDGFGASMTSDFPSEDEDQVPF